ncbi:MAG TPA: radical SAM protein, partial [Gammaproteobacteria bacterium]|nr:radical SAM protein [Gammaproteobacteria bacterium]
LEGILEAAAAAGAGNAGYVLLRLPHEVAPLFVEWLREHYPDRAEHVLSLVKQLRGGELYDSRWGTRQRGLGPFAALLKTRFEKARRRHGLEREVALRCDKFVPPRPPKRQIELGF